MFDPVVAVGTEAKIPPVFEAGAGVVDPKAEGVAACPNADVDPKADGAVVVLGAF